MVGAALVLLVVLAFELAVKNGLTPFSALGLAASGKATPR